MKNILISILVLFVMNVNAANVRRDVAQRYVAIFSDKINGSPSHKATLVYTAISKGDTLFYIFNTSPGWVVISADDRVHPVQGYNDKGDFDPSVINKGKRNGLRCELNKIAGVIGYVRYTGVPLNGAREAWGRLKAGKPQKSNSSTTFRATGAPSAVAPLVQTTWNQEPYYNALCPYNAANGEYAVTGCVATAMAQILKYWSNTASGSGGIHSYTDAPPSYSNNYGVQTFNFTRTWDWANMPLSITNTNNAVDTLMYACGVAVDMDYGDDDEGGSGAYVLQADAGNGNACAQSAYVTYFGMDATKISGVYAANYTAPAWSSLLMNEIGAGRPIQYAGADPNAGGHTWVCDGYDANGLMHMNWGWGGADNGYFNLTNLNPSGYAFNQQDEALIGIQPSGSPAPAPNPTPTPTPASTVCSPPFNCSTGSITTTSAILYFSDTTNYNGKSLTTICFKTAAATKWSYVTTSQLLTATIGYPENNLIPGTTYQWYAMANCTGGQSVGTPVQTFTTAAAACGLSITLTPSGCKCNSDATGSISAAVVGGTAPYIYAWSNGATTQNLISVTAGNYTLTVSDAKDCTGTGSTTIAQPTPIVVTGGTPPYSAFTDANGCRPAKISRLVLLTKTHCRVLIALVAFAALIIGLFYQLFKKRQTEFVE